MSVSRTWRRRPCTACCTKKLDEKLLAHFSRFRRSRVNKKKGPTVLRMHFSVYFLLNFTPKKSSGGPYGGSAHVTSLTSFSAFLLAVTIRFPLNRYFSYPYSPAGDAPNRVRILLELNRRGSVSRDQRHTTHDCRIRAIASRQRRMTIGPRGYLNRLHSLLKHP